MVGCKIVIKKSRSSTMEWLSTLLSFEFFNVCEEHQHLRKNERNVFCIDCNLGFCRNCESAHSKRHRLFQICKYVYQDVVRLHDMQKHLNCSKIQTYKINGEKAVHLNPRPQLKDARPSTKSKTGASCEACGRYLQDPPNRFCSIACKISLVPITNHVITASAPVEEVPALSFTGFSGEIPRQLRTKSPGMKPRNKRKGVPRRAPFF